jgi:hypothetical protein
VAGHVPDVVEPRRVPAPAAPDRFDHDRAAEDRHPVHDLVVGDARGEHHEPRARQAGPGQRPPLGRLVHEALDHLGRIALQAQGHREARGQLQLIVGERDHPADARGTQLGGQGGDVAAGHVDHPTSRGSRRDQDPRVGSDASTTHTRSYREASAADSSRGEEEVTS